VISAWKIHNFPNLLSLIYVQFELFFFAFLTEGSLYELQRIYTQLHKLS
jgi:hypothetical protein